MLGLKTLVGIQQLEEENRILTNMVLMGMQCSPAFYTHMTLMAKEAPYVSFYLDSKAEEQLQVLNLYAKVADEYTDIVKLEAFFMIRTK